jgi:hypothetical protein
MGVNFPINISHRYIYICVKTHHITHHYEYIGHELAPIWLKDDSKLGGAKVRDRVSIGNLVSNGTQDMGILLF